MRLLRAILARPVSVLMTTLTLVVLGFFSLLELPVSLLPTLERPRLKVVVRDQDRSREELLQEVVEPLERRFLSLPGVLRVEATVDDGHGVLVLESEWQSDVDRLRIDAERRLAGVTSAGLDELSLTVEAAERWPIVEVAVLGGESAHQRTGFADKILVPELARLEGAGQIHRIGGAKLRPVVRPRGADLVARGLDSRLLTRRLLTLGQTRPAGRVRDGGTVRPLVVREPIHSLEELKQVRLGDDAGVALGEVATVTLEEVSEEGLFRLDGEDAVLVQVFRSPGANAVALARRIRQTLEESFPVHGASSPDRDPSTLRVAVVRDSSREVVAALGDLGLAGLVGLLLGTGVLRLMMGYWRATVALGVVVPASLVASFGGFYLWDVSLDVVSLAGLALAAGMLVDNAIVVLESIDSCRERGEDEPVLRGTGQIALALVASFLTTAVVFLPLLYLRGLARAFFGVQAFAIVTSLAFSLVLSLTLTPVLARLARRGPRPAPGEEKRWSPGRDAYLRGLEWALGHRLAVVTVAVVLASCGGVVLRYLPRELVPEGASRTLVVDYRLPPGLPPDEAHGRVRDLERHLVAALHGVGAGQVVARRTTALYSPAGERADPRGRDTDGSIEITLSQTAAEADRKVRDALRRSVGVEAEVRWRRSAFVSALESSGRRLEIEVAATSQPGVQSLARRVQAHLREGTGLSFEAAGERRPRPALYLSWDPFRLALLGVDPSSLTDQVRSGLGGFFAGRVAMDNVEPEILVEGTVPRELGLVPLSLPPGDPASSPTVVPAAALASVQEERREAALERRDARASLRLVATGTDLEDRLVDPRQLSQRLDELSLGAEEWVRLGGETFELERSFRQLRFALGLALVLAFLTVAALYESLTLPLVVMTTVPLAAVGALGALLLAGESLNVLSFLGVILLAGIVVNNAIVLLHRIEELRVAAGEGFSFVVAAARERYRPIVMTTLTTLLGMLPLAFLGGEGAQLRRSLALAVAGGLATALFASLFLVPVLYTVLVRGSRGGRRDG